MWSLTRCTTILTCGLGTVRSIASITRSMYDVASWPTENPARAPPSSTVKASRAQKKGAWIVPHGYDAGQEDQGQEAPHPSRYSRLLLHALVHSPDIQDRDGGVLVMATLFGLHPFLLKLYADGGYRGPIFQSALAKSSGKSTWRSSNAPISQRALRNCPSDGSCERTIAWLNRCRRWPRIGSASTERPWRSCASPLSASC
jgi:hypothetical protein